MRASVLHGQDPVGVLAELNEAILRQGLDLRFCTVLYVALRRGEGGWEARIASGGHPLPLVLRADGSVVQAGHAGTLLGIVPDPDLSADRVVLGPGDALVAYTDGVIEASPLDDAFGPRAFAGFLGGQAGRPAGAIASAVEDEVLALQSGRLRDDLALVVLRVASGA
jgi:phosphoserine phosphatase RsbU/P